MNMGQYRNHLRWCDKNPKVEEHKKKNSEKLIARKDDEFGLVVDHQVTCACCGTEFSVKEREKLFPQKKRYFCSRNCANSEGGKAKAKVHHNDGVARYTTVAWRHHEKKCIVCGESKIVAAHHYNGVHSDNRPENLVPLCPTHHQYVHSRHKKDVMHIVDAYVANFIKEKI